MEFGNIYFYTATITNWRNLLEPNKYKDIIIDSLRYLVNSKKIKLYGFVIMPNHIHFIWELLEFNGKEMPHASFMKFTSHQIQKDLQLNHPKVLDHFKVNTDTRTYQFWQRDSMATHLYSPEVIYQKLDYIHNNPCQGKWMLATSPLHYNYSSATFYETGIDEFELLSPIGEKL